MTVGLTIPFSHHLLAVNQACHPGAIDRAVSLCETCLSKPLYTVVDWVPSFFSLSVLPVSWFLSPYSHLKYEVIDMLPLFFVLQVNLESGMVFGLAMNKMYFRILYFCHIPHLYALPFEIPTGKTKSLCVLHG